MSEHIDDLIQQLRRISPLPEDEFLTEELLDTYVDLLGEFDKLRDPKCMEPILAAFGYGYAFETYWAALHLLERFPGSVLEPQLLSALTHPNPGTRMWAAYMLGRWHLPAHVPALVKLLSDPAAMVRENAAKALGMIGDGAARPELEKLRTDPDPTVRKIAEEAISHLRA